MDSIYIDGLEVNATIGVYDWEKKVEQKLIIDLDLTLDLTKAGESDHLDDTLDYGQIAEQIHSLAVAKHYQLIEHFAAVIAKALLADVRLLKVAVVINKPAAVANVKRVGVKIIRSQGDL